MFYDSVQEDMRRQFCFLFFSVAKKFVFFTVFCGSCGDEICSVMKVQEGPRTGKYLYFSV